MKTTTKRKLLWTTASLCGVVALLLGGLAVALIGRGAYPPEGTGSLGHVGMVIAGIIAAFFGLFLAGVVLVCASRLRTID